MWFLLWAWLFQTKGQGQDAVWWSGTEEWLSSFAHLWVLHSLTFDFPDCSRSPGTACPPPATRTTAIPGFFPRLRFEARGRFAEVLNLLISCPLDIWGLKRSRCLPKQASGGYSLLSSGAGGWGPEGGPSERRHSLFGYWLKGAGATTHRKKDELMAAKWKDSYLGNSGFLCKTGGGNVIVPHVHIQQQGFQMKKLFCIHTGSGRGRGCSLIKKGGRVLKNPRSHLLLNRNNSFAFLSVPVDQLGDKCCFFNRSHLWGREGRQRSREGGRRYGVGERRGVTDNYRSGDLSNTSSWPSNVLYWGGWFFWLPPLPTHPGRFTFLVLFDFLRKPLLWWRGKKR